MQVRQKREWSDEEKQELTRKALSCDSLIVDDLIDCYIPTAMRSASWYVRKAPTKRDDIFGAGLYGLVIACHRACDGRLKDDNIEYYIKSIVLWAVQDFLRKDFLVAIPQREFSKRIAKFEE